VSVGTCRPWPSRPTCGLQTRCTRAHLRRQWRSCERRDVSRRWEDNSDGDSVLRLCYDAAKAARGRDLCFRPACRRLDDGGRRRRLSQIAGPWLAAERREMCARGLCFGRQTGGPGADKGRTRATSIRRPRPRKLVPDLGRVWVVPDAAAIRFRDRSARWAAFLSGSTQTDARARFGSRGWRCP
jgi:hypothetical protein